MKTSVLVASLFSAVTLAACVAEDTYVTEMNPDACGASNHQNLIGQNRSALSRINFKVPVRVLEPGSVMTMDYISSRLNVELDESGKIVRLYCS